MPEVAYSMRGALRIAPPPANITRQSLQLGRVNIRLYAGNGDNFCSGQILAEVIRAIPSPDLEALLDVGQTYYFSVLKAPGMTFPMKAYPVAEWQTTEIRDNGCEHDAVAGVDRYNARGAYGVSGDSSCCGGAPNEVVIPAEGAEVTGIDFVLKVRDTPCVDPTTVKGEHCE